MFEFHQLLRSLVVWLHLFTHVARRALVKTCVNAHMNIPQLKKTKQKRVVTEQKVRVCKYIHTNAECVYIYVDHTGIQP